MKKSITNLFVFAVVLVFSVQVQAALQTIGTAGYDSDGVDGVEQYNLIYDDDFEITWLDYTNGMNNWDNQMSWASGLNTGGVLTYNFNAGVSMSWSGDWQLPTTTNPDPSCDGQYDPGHGYPLDGWGYNCINSTMGHLYYTELRKTGGGPLGDTEDFQNLLSGRYWSSTEYAPSTGMAWDFATYSGSRNRNSKSSQIHYAMAVRSGLAVVPEPISLTLFLIGGVALGLRRFRKGTK